MNLACLRNILSEEERIQLLKDCKPLLVDKIGKYYDGEFYPGKHITELGFDSGTFKVKYHFLNVCQKVQSKYRQDKNLGLELIFDTRVYY